MMVKQTKKILLLMVLVSAIVTSLYLADTFSLLELSGTSDNNLNIGKWNVKINDMLITDDEIHNFVIDDFIYNGNEFTSENKIAPGSSGYFDLVIDPTDTDVSIRYDISFDFSVSENNSAINIDVEDLTDGSIVKTDNNTYSGIITLNNIKNGVTNTIRVNVLWLNDELNNDVDSELGTMDDGKISIPIIVHVSQFTGQELIPYTE